MREVTYTVPEFLEYLELERKIDKIGYRTKKQMRKALTVGLAVTAFLVNNPQLVFANSGLDAIDELGSIFLTILQRIGYWVALLFAIMELIKCVREGGDKQDVMQLALKYIVIYSSLFLIPRAFDLITEVLS